MKNVYDIKRIKNLNYVLPTQKEIYSKKKEIKVAIVIHLHYLDTIDVYLEYIKKIPYNMDIFLTVSDRDVKSVLQNKIKRNCRIVEKPNRGRDVSAFLVTVRDDILKYEYICFLHDKKEKKSVNKKDVETWIRCLWENMIGSEKYIYNVLTTFEEKADLGLLVPPFPLTEHLGMFYLNPWSENFVTTCELSKKMKLCCDLDSNRPPVALGTVFWARVSALKKLFEIEWKYEDFDEEPRKNNGTISHAIERLLPYVAQDAGYETGWVMTDQYASARFEYMQDVLNAAFKRLNCSLGINWISELNSYEIRLQKLLKFVKNFEYFYLFGAGIYGKKCLAMLKEEMKIPRAILVSDRGQNPRAIEGIPVYLFQKISLSEKCGIIISVSDQYRKEILCMIHNRYPDFSNIYIFD